MKLTRAVCILVLTAIGSAPFAFAQQQTEQSAVNNDDVSVSSNISSSGLARELQRIKEDLRFEDLRNMRNELISDIETSRTFIQEKEKELATKNDVLQSTTAQFRSTSSEAKSSEMLFLEKQLRDIELQIASNDERIADTKSKIEELRTELATAKTNFESQKVQLDAAEQTMRLRQNEMESASNAIDDFYRSIDQDLNVAEIEVRRLRESLGSVTEVTERESLQQELSAALQKIEDLEAKKYSDELNVLEDAFKAASDAEEDAYYEFSNLDNDHADLGYEISDIESQIDRLEEDITYFEDTSELHANDKIYLQDSITAQEASDRQRVGSRNNLQAQIDETELEILGLQTSLSTERKNLQDLLSLQTRVENEINSLLIPRTEENAFKEKVSLLFAALVGLVIAAFFGVTLVDSKVRAVVFSAEAGIQFVTLFSLVIAIILFGITGILEGKELSALLGGISGYILGRVAPAKDVSNKET